MKYLTFTSIFVLALISFFFNTKSVLASHNLQSCKYGSTQARVQLDISDPWKQTITVNPGEQFNVGGFHDGTGQFANDTNILVSGPGMNQTAVNGETIRNLSAGGRYSVSVITYNQTGGGCTETATVIVNPSSTPCYCQYSQYYYHQRPIRTVVRPCDANYSVNPVEIRTNYK